MPQASAGAGDQIRSASKLSPHQRREAIDCLNGGESQADVARSFGRHRKLLYGLRCDDGSDVVLSKPAEDKCRSVRAANPRWLKLSSARHDQQHAKCSSTR
jgi:hypothetical protein